MTDNRHGRRTRELETLGLVHRLRLRFGDEGTGEDGSVGRRASRAGRGIGEAGALFRSWRIGEKLRYTNAKELG